jgi:RimJ/RimL family protein N-acetyltransferase
MAVTLDTIAADDLPFIVEWRKADPAGARTPYDINIDQELAWYRRLQEPGCRDRYWMLDALGQRVGLAGLTGIEWENGRAEIALLVDPELRGKGIGSAGVRLTLEQAFDRMRMVSVYGEVYACNRYYDFWGHQVQKYKGTDVVLPWMKFWGGQHWSAMRFTITAEGWRTWKQRSS